MLETIWLFFAIGTLPFWILCAAFSIIIVGCLEFKKSITATFLLFLGVFLFHQLGVFSWVVQNKIYLIIGIPTYLLVIGPLWAIFRWWRAVENMAEKYKESRRKFLEGRHLSPTAPIPRQYWEEWKDSIRYSSLNLKWSGDDLIVPHPNDHKEEIYMWTLFWPWSVAWYMADEPVRKILKAVYNGIKDVLIKISERAFRDIKLEP